MVSEAKQRDLSEVVPSIRLGIWLHGMFAPSMPRASNNISFSYRPLDIEVSKFSTGKINFMIFKTFLNNLIHMVQFRISGNQ